MIKMTLFDFLLLLIPTKSPILWKTRSSVVWFRDPGLGQKVPTPALDLSNNTETLAN